MSIESPSDWIGLDPVVGTERLALRRFTLDDAPFALQLVNGAPFIRHIGDKGVRTIDDAREYLRTGPLASYEQFGFGLYLVARRSDDAPMGMCGLIKRPTLDDVDLGYAFLPEFWSHGYAGEAASAVVAYGRRVCGLRRIVAITNGDNAASIRVLTRVGFEFERLIRLGNEAQELHLYGRTF